MPKRAAALRIFCFAESVGGCGTTGVECASEQASTKFSNPAGVQTII